MDFTFSKFSLNQQETNLESLWEPIGIMRYIVHYTDYMLRRALDDHGGVKGTERDRDYGTTAFGTR